MSSHRIDSGSTLAPTYAYSSEASLGFFRSGASVTAQSYGTLRLSDVSVSGIVASAGDVVTAGQLRGSRVTTNLGLGDLVFSNTNWLRFQASTVTTENVTLTLFNNGTAATGAWGESFAALNGSSAAVEYARISGRIDANTAGSHRGALLFSIARGGAIVPVATLNDQGTFSVVTDGRAIAPGYAFSSESSLGWYRSAASTMALSNGTLLVNGPMWSSGISVGGGTLIPQISSMSSLVGAFVVQGSSSSFTGIAWAAAGIGDIILCGPFQSGAASSISSGLVPHSLVTVAGQIEFRLSNVSTLVQNQSAQTWVFTRIRPF